MASTREIQKAMLEGFKSYPVFSNYPPRYKEIGLFHKLWLKLTRQPRPVEPLTMPMAKVDTITGSSPRSWGTPALTAPIPET